MKIASLKTKSGSTVPLGNFTVLVGPNNVGKSQTLRDIYRFFLNGQEKEGVVISGINQLAPTTRDDLIGSLSVVAHPTAVEHFSVTGIGSTLSSAEETTYHEPWLVGELATGKLSNALLNAFGKFHVAYLDAGSRLAVAASCEAFNQHTSAPSTLLQGLYAAGEKVEEQFRKAFKDTFAIDVCLDFSGLTRLSLRVARTFPKIPENPREAYPIMRGFRLLDDQGDGFRSFAGVTLSILLAKKRVILLDEPEAFLHPAQARQLGKWIAEHATTIGSQVVLATHNSHFLSGILSAGAEVDVIRLQRESDSTTFHRIPAPDIAALTSSPLLSSQGVLEALFHRGAVVCEGDPDRVIYHTVASRSLDQGELLFLHSQGKQTVKDVCQLLRNAATPTVAVVDIDILNDSESLRALGAALGAAPGTLAAWEAKRTQVAGEIDGVAEATVLAAVAQKVAVLRSELETGAHTLAGVRSALQRIRADSSRWATIKRDGVSALSDEMRTVALELIEECRAANLMIVPVGELEGWIDVGTRQKKKWAPRALKVLWVGKCPPALKEFVRGIISRIVSEA